MLERKYTAKPEECLYHYCSAETFLAICTGKKIRFSDINSMNDSQELQWGYKVWEDAATELHKLVGVDFLDDIDDIIHASSARGLGLASCFSKTGDVLSQWRAYAADGQGYAIGFDSEVLTNMASLPLEILYNREKQLEEVKNAILAIYKVQESQNHSRDDGFSYACFRLYADLVALKNPAFYEENEVRLLHLLNTEISNNSLKLTDSGGTAFEKELPPSEITFFMRDNCPVPYIDLSFSNEKFKAPIKEVILGPKNPALPLGISIFLETVGLPSVVVKKSKASYR
ncbi:DUF2971 domain-containing protein [Pseudomonas sp. HS6]|uniref:DUF2971 domain-containing protein n=1 Tax=Pseudomonas sp. HS6 TaxID=2850559 RepID=UPI002019FDA3|nr:DUF2971 domain-containing protein [Pseudomonas sp. HS6]UQS17212.1 DUF2971 domain-containing protein [Pseudomonas sp. HS6]